MSRGGKRAGAGRKKSADPSVTIRIPLSKKTVIKQWLETGRFEEQGVSHHPTETRKKEILAILHNALLLKANAGGKIKKEIRLAIELIKNAVPPDL